MVKYKLYVEYEGTRYSGWQMQGKHKTVQGTLLDVAEQIFPGEKVDIQGSGRTDAGVHALCQVAHLEAKKFISPDILQLKFNDLLPYDINVLGIEKTDNKFHARHDAKSRTYLYQISLRRTAFSKNHVWWIKDNLNLERMEKASGLFIGMHDFISFADKDINEKSTKVLVNDVSFGLEDHMLEIRITASHFLWKMVRRIIGVLVEVGRGKLSEKDIKKFLNEKSTEPAKYTAPPSGLFLEYVSYEEDEPILKSVE